MLNRILSVILCTLALNLHAQAGKLYFSENKGQWQSPFLARAIFSGGAVFIRENGFRIKMFDPSELAYTHKAFHDRQGSEYTVHGHVLDLSFLGSRGSRSVQVADKAPWYENYFLGNDEDHWVSRLYPVGLYRQKGIYAGIDLVYFTKGDSIEHDLHVAPGADPAQIKFRISGAEAQWLENGRLICRTSVGSFELQAPLAYQESHFGEIVVRTPVSCKFRLREGILDYELGEFDHGRTLIIDPTLIFSTYSGSKGDNFGFTATYDNLGHLYAGGIIDTLHGSYPVTIGAFQTKYGGRGPGSAPVNLPCDISISKYKPDGSSLVYATYLGGQSDEYPHSLVCEPNGNLLVFGTTLSKNFPLVKLTAFDTSHNGLQDIFISKISPDGSTLLAGTLVGGSSRDGINGSALSYNYADEYRGDIITDAAGNIYVATTTLSTNFPVSSFAQQPAKSGANDAVVLSFKPDLSALNWCEYIGGSLDDAAYSIKLDSKERLFVGGGTASSNFPMHDTGLQRTYAGGQADGWVCQMRRDSGFVLTSTYFGSPEYEQIYFIDFDIDDRIYFTGQTEGSWIRTPGTYGKNGTTQFIGRIRNSLDSLELITTFGNATTHVELVPSAFMVDKCYNIYFSGWSSFDFPINGLPTTSDAFQKITDDQDFYLQVLNKDAKILVYATYFGGDQSSDHVDGGTSRFDKSGVVYQSVCASCPNNPPGHQDFPTTSGAAFTANSSWRCSNASFKFDFNITYAIAADLTYTPSKACFPFTTQFTNLSQPGKSYLWDFGDGDTATTYHASHTWKKPGKYTVTLTAIDPASCNVTDKKTVEVEVLQNPEGVLEMENEPCTSKYHFKVTGDHFDTPQWDFGDGQKASGNKVEHIFDLGSFSTKVLLINGGTGCKDSLTAPVNINADSTGQVKLANVFTPNGDGLNDCYRVFGLTRDCSEAEFKIFNRWGERLFETRNLDECWNGTVDNKGVQVPSGTYFYQLRIKRIGNNTKNIQVSGSINLIREPK